MARLPRVSEGTKAPSGSPHLWASAVHWCQCPRNINHKGAPPTARPSPKPRSGHALRLAGIKVYRSLLWAGSGSFISVSRNLAKIKKHQERKQKYENTGILPGEKMILRTDGRRDGKSGRGR